MALKTTTCVIMHHVSRAEPNLNARPWFPVLNSHQEQSAYPGFYNSISVAMHLVEAHKS